MRVDLAQCKGLYLRNILSSPIKPNPQIDTSKKQQVEEMFDNISARYDFLNHFLSLGIDKAWRKIVRKRVAETGAKFILDVATGTADLAIELSKIPDSKIIGIDISRGMLDRGDVKIDQLKLNERITLQQADSEDLPFEDHTFDAITVSFGVRNFENLENLIFFSFFACQDLLDEFAPPPPYFRDFLSFFEGAERPT